MEDWKPRINGFQREMKSSAGGEGTVRQNVEGSQVEPDFKTPNILESTNITHYGKASISLPSIKAKFYNLFKVRL